MSRFGNNGGFAQVTEQNLPWHRYPFGNADVVGVLVRDSCPITVRE
jgi:hypothetical protein